MRLLLAILLASAPAAAAERTADWPRDPATGVLSGGEAFTFDAPGAPAVLLVHGFSSSPREMRGLGEALAAAGFHVRATRLPGHATTPEDLETATAASWRGRVAAEYAALAAAHARVCVVGFSLGGALSAELAAERELAGLVLLGPAFRMTHKWYYVFTPETLAKTVGRLVRFVPKSDGWIGLLDRSQVPEHIAYSKMPTRASREMISVAERARGLAPGIDEPVLVVHGARDHVTDIDASKAFSAALPGARVETFWVANSDHLVTLDYEKDAVIARVVAFLKSL